MHKGRAVCSAVDGIVVGRAAAIVAPIDLLHPVRALRTVGDALGCDSCRIDNHAQMREIILLAA